MNCPLHSLDFGYYGPGSVNWKVNSEGAAMLSGTRAVLMQLAHPLVAVGVHRHSSYMTDPFGRAERTFILGQRVAFGSTRQARRAARVINNLHKHVHGEIPAEAGAYGKGTRYDARDPELLLWVHATLVDSLLLGYKVFVGPLTRAEEDRYYQESRAMAHLLGLKDEQMPKGIDEFNAYMTNMLSSNQLAPTSEGSELARQTLFLPGKPSLRPFMHLNCLITNALLPQPVREIFEMEWGSRQQRAFELATRGMRLVVPRLPRRLRELPSTRQLMRGEMRQLA